MTDPLASLVVDFLGWLEREPRPYADVMEAWRTSCPRLTVWEDAVDRELVSREARAGQTFVVLTQHGRDLLAGRSPAAPG